MDQTPPAGKQAVFTATVNAVVDIDSLEYVANQRVLRLTEGMSVSTRTRAAIAAIYMDAFVTGAMYRDLKEKKAAEDG